MVSFKIPCDLEGYLDLWGQLQGKCLILLYRLLCPFITLSILCRITSNFQLWSLRKGTSGYIGMTSSISLNWHISVIYCRIELKPAIAKSDLLSASVLNMICYKINLVFKKMEETFQSNTLDWSSLVFLLSFQPHSLFITSSIINRFTSNFQHTLRIPR